MSAAPSPPARPRAGPRHHRRREVRRLRQAPAGRSPRPLRARRVRRQQRHHGQEDPQRRQGHIPVLLILGEKEEAAGTVTVRRYGKEEQLTIPYEEFPRRPPRRHPRPQARRRPDALTEGRFPLGPPPARLRTAPPSRLRLRGEFQQKITKTAKSSPLLTLLPSFRILQKAAKEAKKAGLAIIHPVESCPSCQKIRFRPA
ncbi:MAG: His/Gly/Thr/Pro-type tRNA ligase C-terminal domain-containing protein [Kiritimatiellia bacterium]